MYGLSKVSFNMVNLYSDASKHGFGATYSSHWIQGSWPQEWKGYHITILETYPLLALVHTFGHKLRNSFITFYCDNQGVAEIMNKQSSKDTRIMVLVRMLVLKMLELNINFYAVHIPGVNNVLSDRISPFQVLQALLGSYNMLIESTSIPEEIHPSNLKL